MGDSTTTTTTTTSSHSHDGKSFITFQFLEQPPQSSSSKQGRNTRLYRAVRNRSQRSVVTDTASCRPVSIREWAQALAQDDEEGKQLRLELSKVIADAPFPALFWETKGTTYLLSETEPFEFVLIQSNALKSFVDGRGGANPKDFAEHFDHDNNNNNTTNTNNNNNNQKKQPSRSSNNINNNKNEYAVAFRNLSGDALLVVPKPLFTTKRTSTKDGDDEQQRQVKQQKNLDFHAHLVEYCRQASNEQLHGFWRLVAQQYLDELLAKKSSNQPVWLSTCGTGVPWLHVRLDSRPKYYSHAPFQSVFNTTMTTAAPTSNPGVNELWPKKSLLLIHIYAALAHQIKMLFLRLCRGGSDVGSLTARIRQQQHNMKNG